MGSTTDDASRLQVWTGLGVAGLAVLIVTTLIAAPRFSSRGADCPAIGYSSVLQVTLTGDTSRVEHLQVRVGDTWQPPMDGAEGATAPSRDGDTWSFTLFSPPDPVALRALDDIESVVARTEKHVGWERVGGSEECGGPMEGRVGWTV
ncbi:hypothetical protein [Isoptericola sp. BMS4]|uniref:hypothetical protein n=1 Tax=Isoptericola sp. BMS4 TaxID=2527875 RepID=UPI001421B79A|nr:hypothetical protein [Isoptericola sp. BMS4]